MVSERDIAYTVQSNDLDIDLVYDEYIALQLAIIGEPHEYEYKGKAIIKISTSVTLEIPFSLKISVDDLSDGVDTLYNHLYMQYKKMYSMIDMTVKITSVHKIK